MSDNNTREEGPAINRLESVLTELTRPFNPDEIRWRVQSYSEKSGKALVIPYLDARNIQERLDEVVPGEWEIRFRRESLSGPGYIAGHVVYASLTVCGVTREDVGSSVIPNTMSMQGGSHFQRLNDNQLDPKTATSDSVKRAGAQFGIGRYLWRMDKPVFIDAKGNDGQNKFRYAAPKYADVPKWAHDYLMELALESQVVNRYSGIEVAKFLVEQIVSGQISAENMLGFLDTQGQNALVSLVARMKANKK